MEEVLTDPQTVSAFLQSFKLALSLGKEYLNRKWQPNKNDEQAAWAMYIEMVTRVVTQPLPPNQGDEATALKSVHSLFETTREVLKEHGRECKEFPAIAVEILNQKVRPFTTQWHSEDLEITFENESKCDEFRDDLERLQEILCEYTRALAAMAKVEDLTNLSEE